TRLPDIARPDSRIAREFAKLVDAWLYGENTSSRFSSTLGKEVKNYLNDLASSAGVITFVSELHSFYPPEILPLAEDLKESCEIGKAAVSVIQSESAQLNEDWRNKSLARLGKAAEPKAAVELVVIQPIKELVLAAAEKEKRKTMTVEEWKNHVKALAEPKKK